MAVATPSGGRWVTIRGTHVFVSGGRVVAGPRGLLGKSESDAARQESEPAPVAPSAHPQYRGKIKTPSTHSEAQLDEICRKGGMPGLRETIAAVVPDDKVFPEVWVGLSNKGDLRVKGRGADAMSTMDRDLDFGKKTVVNELFELAPELRGGLGTELFTRQVERCSALGFERMETYAGRSGSMNGYYTWPRLGYDGGSLKPGSRIFGMSDSSVAEMRRLAGTDTPRISDLMKTSEGRSWWKENGVALNLTFDLNPGSQSRRVLEAYTAAKKGTK